MGDRWERTRLQIAGSRFTLRGKTAYCGGAQQGTLSRLRATGAYVTAVTPSTPQAVPAVKIPTAVLPRGAKIAGLAGKPAEPARAIHVFGVPKASSSAAVYAGDFVIAVFPWLHVDQERISARTCCG